MNVRYQIMTGLALTLCVCPKVYAPIFGSYPGLRSLIKEADLISAVTILERLSEDDFGGSARYKVQFERVLKGKAPEKQAVASLRYLAVMDLTAFAEPSPSPGSKRFGTTYFAPTDRLEPFRTESRWIAFLTKARKDVDATYENVNCMGSMFPLSPLRDLDALKVESLPDTLIFLFREYVDFKRTEVKELEKELDAFIRQRDK